MAHTTTSIASQDVLNQAVDHLASVNRDLRNELDQMQDVGGEMQGTVLHSEDLLQREVKRAPIWFVSIAFHCMLLFVLTMINFAMPREKRADIVVSTQIVEKEEPPYDPKRERKLFKEKKEVEVEVEIDAPPIIVDEDVKVDDHFETDNNMDMNSALGDEDSISNIPLSGKGLVGTIGVGGGGGGSFGNRMGGGRRNCVMRGGGSKASESAVDAALRWLARHQEKDGSWDSKKWGAEFDLDEGLTGLSLLAFLGAGHTEFIGKYRHTVRKGIQWLCKQQRKDGSFVPITMKDRRGWNYTNGICLMALAEALGMGGSSMARESAIKTIDFLLAQQNPSGAWNYQRSEVRDDMSITGWVVMGFKSSVVAGLRVKEIKASFRKCGELLDSFEEFTGDNTSSSKGKSWYVLEEGKIAVRKRGPGSAVQAIAMLTRQFMGWHRGEPWLMGAADAQIKHMPKNWEERNVYRMYYACLSLFQMGGKWWQAWNKPVRDMIIMNQRRGAPDIDGSWDYDSKWCKEGGRVMSTAMLCLCLEVYYRYASVYK